MAAAHVQDKSASFNLSANTIVLAFDAPVGNGNLVCGMVLFESTTDIVSSITDDQSNVYTKIDTLLNIESDSLSALTFYCKNITNAPQTVTVNLSSSVAKRLITIREASGLDTTAPLDKNTAQSQSNPGNGVDAITSGAVNTTTDGQYVAGFSCDPFQDKAPGWLLAGTGFSNFDDAGTTARYIASESLIQASAGSVAGTFTQSAASGEDYGTFVATFKAASGAVVNLLGQACL